VFTGEFGGLMPPETPSHIFENIIKKYDLPKIKFHELRHTSVSLLINAGIQTQLISRRVGHSSVSTTSNIYSHIFNSTECEATQKLNEILKVN
jgi:integrase